MKCCETGLDIPTYLRRLPCILPHRKPFRRRGKRGGALVQQKAHLTASSVTYARSRCHGPPAARHVRDQWICPVFPELRPLLGPLAAPLARLTAPGPRGVQHAHLRQLRRTTPSEACTFFSSPRATGHGGGIASVFRANLQCRLLHPVSSYASF